MTRLLALLLVFLASPALADVQVEFSPGHATEAVVGVIDAAQKTVHVAAYSFTSKPIAQALLDARKRGVEVRAVLDKSNESGRYSAATFLSRGGVGVRIDERYSIMHNKFIVVDGVTVETGSFNFTQAAGKQAENVLILRDDQAVARRYEQEWNRLWSESRDYPAGEAP